MKRPFWAHQAAEYLLGIILISACVQAERPAGLAISGALILVNCAIADGPLGAFRLIRRPLHRWLDIVLVGGLLALAIVAGGLFDSTSRLITIGVCAVLAVVIWNSNYAPKAPKAPVSMEGGRSAEIGRMAGRATGNAVNFAKAVKKSRQKP